MRKIHVRMWAGYMEEPLMFKETDIFKHKDVNELDISADLKADIQAWDDEYQDTLDHSDPLSSGFSSEELKNDHGQRGAQLSVRLQEELGNEYQVEFKQS